MRSAVFAALALFGSVPVRGQNADWKSYVLGPSSREVHPTAVHRTSPIGVTNPDAILGKGDKPTRLTAGTSRMGWPQGTSATASSTHGPNNGNGDGPRTYDAKNAVDGTTATFFNDETEGNGSADWLSIASPSSVTVGGVTVVSSADGHIQDFVVETSDDGSKWTKQANVTNNDSLAPFVKFPASVSFKNLRITVTRNHDAGRRIYTRIAEVILGELGGESAWPQNTRASASSEHPPSSNEPSYAASNAIDGNQATFWNDNTENAYPDVLTVVSGEVVVLPGITVVSNSDGAPQDFTVETSPDGNQWVSQATIKDNTNTVIPISFKSPASVKSLRITATKDQNNGKGIYTRVAEVLPRVEAVPFVDVDFGKVVAGRLELNIAAASNPPPQIRLAFSETDKYLGYSSDYSASDYFDKAKRGGTDDLVPAPGGEKWTDDKKCQFGDLVCTDGLRGFRYVRIYLAQTPGAEAHSSPSGWVELAPGGVTLAFTAYVGTPETYKGHFVSSDDLLNRIWYACIYTNEVNTDTFTRDTVDPRNAFSESLDGKVVLHDGAKRDRDPYVGDTAVQVLIDLVSHADLEGARNVLLDLALHQRADGWIPPASISNYGLTLFDYSAWWVISSGDFVLYTAEKEFASQIWDAVKKLMDGWYPSVTNGAGLLDKSGDWSGYGDYAFLPRQGVITYYNGNYVRALRSASLIAKFLGHNDEAGAWSGRADAVSAAIAASDLWDAQAGAWRDSGAGGRTNGCHSQDATAFAILSNSSTPERSAQSLAYLSKTLKREWGNAFVDQDCFGGGTSDRVYNFISHPEVMARFHVGDDAGALELIRRSWGFQVSRDPTNTFWEAVGTGGDIGAYQGPFSSMAHGWAAGAAVALSTRVLGVEPTSPGFATYDVIPHPGDIEWASGAVPTPKGPVNVSWKMVDGKLQLDVDGPESTFARVGVPVARRDGLNARSTRSVVLNGRTVWSDDASLVSRRAIRGDISFNGDYVFISRLPSGKHSIVSM